MNHKRGRCGNYLGLGRIRLTKFEGGLETERCEVGFEGGLGKNREWCLGKREWCLGTREWCLGMESVSGHGVSAF